ncbi:hypothetical protein PG990_009905 [Apiospora arundinis]|uniref:Uncharacterized protein n=1 Tax=Apiospora arundinis TaxID=335852 RepID=A0ABR2IVB8_9PEZI
MMASFGAWLFQRVNSANRNLQQRQQVQQLQEGGPSRNKGDQGLPLIQPDISSLSIIDNVEEVEVDVVMEAEAENHGHDNDNGNHEDDDETYIYDIFARPSPLPPPKQQQEKQKQQDWLQEEPHKQHYWTRLGERKERVRDVHLHRLQSRQKAAADAPGDAGRYLGGRWKRREDYGDVIEIGWVEA